MSSCRVSYGLSTQCKILLLSLNRTKTLEGASMHPPPLPPPPLYDDRGMNLLVRPRVTQFYRDVLKTLFVS